MSTETSTASVVLCAPGPGEPEAPWLGELESALRGRAVPLVRPVVPPDDGDAEPPRARAAHWVAHTAIAVGGSGVPAPVLLVAAGSATALLPALSFAQRAARRPVGGYVMVGGSLPEANAGGDWPDAPVMYVVTPDADDESRAAALTARLRGWDVVEGDPVDVVVARATGG